MDKETLYDLIDRHIRNELTEEERIQIATLVENDPEFVKELTLHTEIKSAVADKDLLDFKQKIAESHERYTSNTVVEKKQRTIALYLKIAASILLVMSVGAFFWLSEKNSTHQELFEAYFIPYEAPVNFRSDTSPYTDEDWKQALMLYDNKQYVEAIPYLNKVVAEKPGNTLALFLRGVSYLAIDSMAAAEKDFNAIIIQENNLFAEQAKWYLALTYLKADKVEPAKALLHELAKEKTTSKAFELWKRLE